MKLFDEFIEDIQEYDSMVNQTLLPMIKTKLNNPKDKLIKELNEHKLKVERIKKAYINGSFTIEEYDTEKAIVENVIKDLEHKIIDCEINENLNLIAEDVLIRKDIDYINKIGVPEDYEKNTETWKDLTREENVILL